MRLVELEHQYEASLELTSFSLLHPFFSPHLHLLIGGRSWLAEL